MGSGAETKVTALTETLGVIGNPVRHSLSPVLQNALLDLLGIDACYHAFEVASENVRDAIRGAGALGFRGLNVTVPHKQLAAQLCHRLTKESRTLGVANTLLFRNGQIHGHTTDSAGFLRPLRARGFDLAGSRIVLIGAGGAARAVAYACAKEGAALIHVLNRTVERAQELVRFLQPLFQSCQLVPRALNRGELESSCRDADLIVNATTLGMWPDVERSPLPDGVQLPPRALAYDLVYNPLQTRFLLQAQAQGLRTQDGLDMLIYQAIGSLEFWFDTQIGGWEEIAGQVRPILLDALARRRGDPEDSAGRMPSHARAATDGHAEERRERT